MLEDFRVGFEANFVSRHATCVKLLLFTRSLIHIGDLISACGLQPGRHVWCAGDRRRHTRGRDVSVRREASGEARGALW